MLEMNKNISDYKWVMLWAADVCYSLSWAAPKELQGGQLPPPCHLSGAAHERLEQISARLCGEN